MIALTVQEFEALAAHVRTGPTGDRGIVAREGPSGTLVLDEDAWLKRGHGRLPTAQEIAALVAAFVPSRQIDLSALLERLTRKEKADAGAFMLANPEMLLDILEAAARGDFRSDNPDTGRFTQALIDARIVTAERLNELLS